MRGALIGMVEQFGYYVSGHLMTGGLSALEDAFDVLGWTDPHPAPELACQYVDADGNACGERRTCGSPTPSGYLWTCGEHRPHDKEEEGGG